MLKGQHSVKRCEIEVETDRDTFTLQPLSQRLHVGSLILRGEGGGRWPTGPQTALSACAWSHVWVLLPVYVYPVEAWEADA
jgi:hypothetical protein